MARKSIFYNALLLTGVNLLLRFVSTSFQIYLSSRIGAEGIGLMQLVMTVGGMATVAAMAGVRTATMYLTAEELGRGRPQNYACVLSACVSYSVAVSGAVSAALYLLAPTLAVNWVGSAETEPALRLLAVLLPMNCLCGVMVGFFTGAGKITTLAAVEVAEQACSMVCTMALLTFWAGSSRMHAVESVILGTAMGTALTLCCLCILRLRQRGGHGSREPIARRLLSTAVPLALADDLRTGISTVENLMVPKRLALYAGAISPLAAFGMVNGMVFPVLMFPMAILFGLTELLVPELARCRAAGSEQRVRYLVRKSLGIALLFGAFCAGIPYLLADFLGQRLYRSAEVGEYLRWFAPLAVMLYLDAVTDAMIKGLGQQTASVRYNIFTNSLDVALLYVLLPEFGIFGYYLSFLVTHVINFFLSLRRLLRISGVKISAKLPLACLASAAFAAYAATYATTPVMKTICYTLLLGALWYLTGVVQRQDLRWLITLMKKKGAA